MEDVLPFLRLTISAHATTINPDGRANTTVSKHEIASRGIDATSVWLTTQSGASSVLVWKQELLITRPRGRSQNPAVYYTAALTLKPEIVEQATREQPHYLANLETLSPNVLGSLQLGEESRLYLPESKITKVTPPSPEPEDVRGTFRGASKKALPVTPAIIPRLRYTSLADKVLLSIQLEASQSLAGNVIVHDVEITVPAVSVERIGAAEGQLELQPGDEVDHIYKLVKDLRPGQSDQLATVTITIKASVMHATKLHATLDLKWQTQMDMSYTPQVQHHAWSSKQQATVAAKETPQELTTVFDFEAPRSTKVDSIFRLRVRCTNNSARSRRFAVEIDTSDHERLLSTVALTPHMRLDAIEAGGCGEASIEYKANVAGALDLGLLHIVDLDTQESILVDSLPDVIAVM